jgi:hypothetical protein
MITKCIKYFLVFLLQFNVTEILAQGIQALDGSNRHFRFATVYDWDCCLLGIGYDEGQPYLVDGHFKIQYDDLGQGVIVESTGYYASYYPVGTSYNSTFGSSSDPLYKSLVTNAGCCNPDGSRIYVLLSGEITVSNTPTITSFAPSSASPGTVITITGTNLNSVSSVSFGGVLAASFIQVTSATITAIVGSGASGSVSITTPFGSASLTGFTFIAAPKITLASIEKTTMCLKDSFDVGYHATGTYNLNNSFIAYLSASNGNFNTETEMPTRSILTGLIKCYLPESALPSGSGYKIRIKSTNPVSISDTSSALIFYDKPHFANDTSITLNCNTDLKNLLTIYNTNGYTLYWNTLTPTAAGLGKYIVRAVNTNGCSDTATVTLVQDVSIWTGNVNSDWHTLGNWKTNRVPTSQTHVIIPSNRPSCIVSTTDAHAASVQVKLGATLLLINGHKVNIVGRCSSLPLF